MSIEIGRVEGLFRYPVKSMRGEALDEVQLGWHGVEGDRRFAVRRENAQGGNPWLSAGRLSDLLAYTPLRRGSTGTAPPTHVRTPDGDELELLGDELATDIGRRHGEPVRMLELRHGVFDEASVSVLAASTLREIGRLAGVKGDVRRFRPNVLVRTTSDVPFEDDDWVGGTLAFGDDDEAPLVAVSRRDLRCVMVNIDPEGGPSTPEVMKACVRVNDNHAGVYAEVMRTGRLVVGRPVFLRR